MKIISLVGARPQFIKEALVGEVARNMQAWEHVLVHSGQHYDVNMSDVFFQELGIPEPKYHLGVGSGLHGSMTASALTAMENVLIEERADALLVYGDTNTTLAGALAAAKLGIPIIHVEAGIRMEPKTMPEEINRVLTDRISSVMCCCSTLAVENLLKEGLTQGVYLTGDVMYDLFLRFKHLFESRETITNLGLEPGRFIIATLHRDYNVDKQESLHECLHGLTCLAEETNHKVLLPLHPRTRKNIEKFNLQTVARTLNLINPIGYIDLMALVQTAAFVITDSGGLQKEAYYAKKRCVVIMPDTGWRELTDCGWNILVEPSAKAIVQGGIEALASGHTPENIYGDGKAAERIVQIVLEDLA